MTKERHRTALVAGGSGAIGSAICHVLAEDGFDVIVGYHRNRAAAQTLIDGLRPGSHRPIALDLSDDPAVAIALRDYPALDCVVYAAGPTIPMRYVEQIESAEFLHFLAADAGGCFHLVKHALRPLRAARGCLIALGTVALTRTVPRDILSAAPKAVVEQLVRAVSLEYGRFGVRANCVAPGIIDGGLIHHLLENGTYNEEVVEFARKQTPLQRIGLPEDVARVVRFLASGEATWITGQTFTVDGGYSR